MRTSSKLRLYPHRLAMAGMIVAFAGLAATGGQARAAADSGRVLQFRTPIDDAYTQTVLCPFPLAETVQGWEDQTVQLDPAGNIMNVITHDHLTYTDTAFGRTVTENFFSTRFWDGTLITNPDGTVTIIQRRVGNLSDNAGGSDRGLLDFSLTIDPGTGQELGFSILRNAGQIGGDWSGPSYGWDQAAYCEQFTG